MNEILSLNQVAEIQDFGGKAVNLGKLIRAGLPVPDGFAVSVRAFDATSGLAEEFKSHVKNLFVKDKLYAVRSSATVEDAEEASWAGQFESYLNVKPKDIIKRIEDCHNSANARTTAYAKQQFISKDLTTQVAVVVQEMVPATFAGVMFTKDPSDGSNKIIIEYVHGLGESLVHGDADPERIAWSRTKRIITEQTEEKLPVPVMELIKFAEKIERNFKGIPQDIEWAYADGQLWIVQSRPITTLQERSAGKHYLGDPAKLFYWGPSSAKPLYISDYMTAFEEFWASMAKNPALPNPPKTMELFHDNKVVWLIKEASFANFVSDTYEAYEKAERLEQDIAEWDNAVMALDVYAQKSIDDIEVLATMLNSCWDPTLFAEFALYGSETVITKHLQRFDPKIRQEIWGMMTLPDTPTFTQRLDLELAKTKGAKQLAKQYPWIQDGYIGTFHNAETYFSNRLSIVAGNIELAAGSDQKRQAIIAKHKLTVPEVSALNLARRLSVFMDDRKEWMMRTRSYISACSKLIVLKTKATKQKIEQSTLGVLAAGNTTTPCFGRTYILDSVIELTQSDVMLAWDWYIEFRASKSVLSGVVASTGGRHFMNGEVFIVRSSTDPAPDGCVLVVPFTSPSYVPLMRQARALVTDHGGMMSHAAIVAREFGLPCIVGTQRATKILKDGDKVVLDLVKGEVNR